MCGKGGISPFAPNGEPSTCARSNFGREPDPAGMARSGLHSPVGHIGRMVFPVFDRNASTFLCPLAPRALPRFDATMGTLTPGRLSTTGQVSPIHVHGPLPAFRLQPPRVLPSPLCHATPQRDGFPVSALLPRV